MVESVCVCFPGPSVEVGGENSHKQQVRIQPLSLYLCITLSLDTQALSNKSERKRLPINQVFPSAAVLFPTGSPGLCKPLKKQTSKDSSIT